MWWQIILMGFGVYAIIFIIEFLFDLAMETWETRKRIKLFEEIMREAEITKDGDTVYVKPPEDKIMDFDDFRDKKK